MNKRNASSLLAGVSFEDIMFEETISSDEIRPGNNSNRTSIQFSIIKKYGKLSKKKRAATLALVDWNGHNGYDLRCWNDDYSVPYKGITFSKEEVSILLDSLGGYVYFGDDNPKHVYSGGKATAKIYDAVCTLSAATVRDKRWIKQVSIIDWGYGKKYDFRKWTEDFDKCSKGICLNQEEVDELILLLESI